MIDVTEQISSIQRRVETRLLDSRQVRVVLLGKTFDVSVSALWDAVTSAERIRQWFLPITGDMRLHGSYQLAGNAGGTILSCTPPHQFTATWEYDGDVSWITVNISPESEDRSRIELEHVAHLAEERWAEYGPGAVGVGWELGAIGLFLHLASGEPVDAAAVQSWMMSDAGRDFVTLSSNGWRDANIADGYDRDGAYAAADRTTGAYTATA